MSQTLSNSITISEDARLSLEMLEKTDDAQLMSIVRIVKEILYFFTTPENRKKSRLQSLIGKENIEYLLEKLIGNIDRIKDADTAIELKHLLLNPTVLVLESHDEIYSFLKTNPSLENTMYMQRCMTGRLEDLSEADISIKCCEELEILFKRLEFVNIPEIELLSTRFKSYMTGYTSSYHSLEDGIDHTGHICKGVLYRVFNFSPMITSTCHHTEDNIFSVFVDMLIDKLPLLSKNHLLIYNAILSDKSYMYRAAGKEDSYKILDLLSKIENLDEKIADLIISFFENTRSIDRQYCPDYSIFMMFLELACTLSYSELFSVYEDLFNNVQDTPELGHVRQILFDIVERDFPAIYNLEMIIRSSILECKNSNIHDLDNFLNVLCRRISAHCEIDRKDITALKVRISTAMNDYYYKERLQYLQTALQKKKTFLLSEKNKRDIC